MNDREWKLIPPQPQPQSFEVPAAQRVDPTVSQTGGQGKLIGRMIIEEFEPTDPREEAVNYRISLFGATDATAVHNYGRDLVNKLAARMARGR
jgi:hypothetical protein